MSIYICSDIHGQYDLYKQMLEDIQFSEEDQLFILGDVIDRGPDSVPLLLDVMEKDNVTCLIGNHELMMWEYLHQKPEEDIGSTIIRSIDWIREGNGGLETLAQFVKLPSEKQAQCLNYIREMYLQYELQMPNHIYMLSHSFFVQDEGTLKC